MRTAHVSCLLACLLLVSSCGGGVIQRMDGPPPLPDERRALQIVVAPSDAELFVNGKYTGTIDGYKEGWIALPVTTTRLKVSRIGYYSWYRLVPPGTSSLRITIELIPIIENDPGD